MSEQCIGALEAAITVLHGAGANKEVQLLSVVAGVRGILAQPLVTRMLRDVIGFILIAIINKYPMAAGPTRYTYICLLAAACSLSLASWA